MLKDAGFIQEWIEAGVEQGIERGRAEDAREFLLRLLEAQFGALPAETVARVRQEGPQWCQETGVRALKAASLAELGL